MIWWKWGMGAKCGAEDAAGQTGEQPKMAVKRKPFTAQTRREAIEFARKHSVAEASEQSGVSPSQIYAWVQWEKQSRPGGLEDLRSIPGKHPSTIKPETKQQVIAFARTHPASGCDQLAKQLQEHRPQEDHLHLCPASIQKILNEHNMARSPDRWLALENHFREPTLTPTPEQKKFMMRFNPAFRERHNPTSAPGEILFQAISAWVISSLTAFTGAACIQSLTPSASWDGLFSPPMHRKR